MSFCDMGGGAAAAQPIGANANVGLGANGIPGGAPTAAAGAAGAASPTIMDYLKMAQANGGGGGGGNAPSGSAGGGPGLSWGATPSNNGKLSF